MQKREKKLSYRKSDGIAQYIRRMWPEQTRQIYKEINALEPKGIFMTGIENSDPFISKIRRDQLKEAYDFPANFRTRLKNITDLGLRWVRFGVGYSNVHTANNSFDFSLTDEVLSEADRRGLIVVADLLHFGLPEWLNADKKDEKDFFFQNPDFPAQFAAYARQYAQRYPHIRYFTVINEPYVTAMFSAKLGMWNEQLISEWDDDRTFVRAIGNIAKAAILARQAIKEVFLEEKRSVQPLFFQNDSFEVVYNSLGQGRKDEAARFNLRRYAALDLIFGNRDSAMREYLLSQGMSEDQYEWFMNNGSANRQIVGVDHYPWCVSFWRYQNPYQQLNTLPNNFSYPLHDMIVEYWRRYPLPIMHMEVNAWPDQALEMCQRTYEALSRLRQEGYPLLGMSWYGDDLQIGWQSGMVGAQAYEETRVGLFYKGELEPVGRCYADLAKQGFPPTERRQDHVEAKAAKG